MTDTELDIWVLLPKHFNNMTTETEQLVIQKWLNKSDENRQIYKDVKKIWLSKKENKPYFDSMEAFSKLKNKLN